MIADWSNLRIETDDDWLPSSTSVFSVVIGAIVFSTIILIWKKVFFLDQRVVYWKNRDRSIHDTSPDVSLFLTTSSVEKRLEKYREYSIFIFKYTSLCSRKNSF